MIGALQVCLYAAICAFLVFFSLLRTPPQLTKCHVKNGRTFVLVFPSAGVFLARISPLSKFFFGLYNEADGARWQDGKLFNDQ